MNPAYRATIHAYQSLHLRSLEPTQCAEEEAKIVARIEKFGPLVSSLLDKKRVMEFHERMTREQYRSDVVARKSYEYLVSLMEPFGWLVGIYFSQGPQLHGSIEFDFTLALMSGQNLNSRWMMSKVEKETIGDSLNYRLRGIAINTIVEAMQCFEQGQ